MENPAETIITAIKGWNARAHEYEWEAMSHTFADVRGTGTTACLEELQLLVSALERIDVRLSEMAVVRGRETPYRAHFAAWTEAVMGQDHAWSDSYEFSSVITTEAFSGLESLAFQWESEARTAQLRGIRPRDVDALRVLLEEVEQLCVENEFLPSDVIDVVRDRAALVQDEWNKLNDNEPHQLSAAVRDLLVVMIMASEMSKENDPGWRTKLEEFANAIVVGGVGGLLTNGLQWVGGIGLHALAN